MNRLAMFVAAAVQATVVMAADKPLLGPAPAWVQPVQVPRVGKADDAALRVLLDDQQIRFAAGRTETYSASALHIQTPEGLEAGNIAFTWRPETDAVTVHKLLIRRGDEAIDVLKSGQSFTVMRRETDLENAVFDGRLTASILPEGLRVGDILEFAATTTSSDPVMKGHVEAIAAQWNGYSIVRAHLRAEWPSTLPVRVRATKDLPAGRLVKRGDTTSYELALDNVEPQPFPAGAPPRYGIGRAVEFSDFRSWAEAGALEAPYYARASQLPSGAKLLEEVERIRRLSPDPEVRAAAALTLVQDRIRYVMLGMNDGGLVPADAETTWSRRFGDCKAKTVVLLALLGALGIEAEPVAVSLSGGDGIDERLPMIGHFDHVMVRATIAGKTHWLDGTRKGDRRLDAARVAPLRWGLLLRSDGTRLVPIMPPPLERPLALVTLTIDATDGIAAPAPAKAELLMRGDLAIAAHSELASQTPDARDRALRRIAENRHAFIKPSSVSFAFDADAQELRVQWEGMAELKWRGGRVTVPGLRFPSKPDLAREPGPDRDAPYANVYPTFSKTVTTIRLPAGFSATDLEGEDVDKQVAGAEYRRRSTLNANVLTVETSVRSLAPEFPASELASMGPAMNGFAGTAVTVSRPRGYGMTRKEIEAAIAAKAETADEFVDRSNILLDEGRLDEARSDIDQALKLQPRNRDALAMRGLILVWQQDFEAARQALDAAQAADPRNAVVYRARGLMAQMEERPTDAVAAYTVALEITPNNAFTLFRRAQALADLDKRDRALDDAAAAIRQDPKVIDAYLLRANLQRGDKAKAVAEADALLAANPDNPYAQIVAARIYDRFGMSEAALRAVNRSIEIEPSAIGYLNRSDVRPRADRAGRLADIQAALRIDPKLPEAMAAKAWLEQDGGDYKGAIQTWTAAIAADPDEPEFLLQRAIARLRAGQATLAATDFASARAKARSPTQLNEICWAKGTAGVDLTSALADCDAALAAAPDTPAYLDSRGLVLLRLGRLDDAIASYDRALAKEPDLSPSLFGRAVAWRRKGDTARSDADLAAAMKANADIRADFESYGITL